MRTVYFDHKIVAVDIEIHDIITDAFLAVYGNGETLQKLIPEHLFFGGHVLAEFLGVWYVLGIVIQWH